MLRSRYRVIQRLGSGGGGTVYAVEDSRAGNARVALKAMWPSEDARPLLAALRAEFRVLATLRHPRLGRVYDFGRLPPGSHASLPGAPAAAAHGGMFLTRALIDGDDLNTAATANGRDLPTICRWLADAAALLDVLHRAGMRHGDFKPANAIVAPDGRVHLIDFGLAAGEHARVSAGTLPYVAPEILARRPVDRRADLYALGIAMFELCTGVLPSGFAKGTALIDWHAQPERPPLPNAPRDIAAVCTRLMAADPAQRYPTAREAAAALEPFASGAVDSTVHADVAIPVPAAQIGEVERFVAQRARGDGGPGMVEIVGEVGSGRSNALLEVAWRAELAGAEVVRADVGAAGGAVDAALAQIASLVGTSPPPAADQLGRFRAIADWLRAASRTAPIVIALDDADFADPTSQALVAYLGRALPADARAIVVATRTAAGVEPTERIATGSVPRVALPALSAAEIGDVVRRVAGRADDALAGRIAEHTGGNALHVAACVRALAASGFAPGLSLRDAGVPPALEAATEREIAAASADERAVLDAMAVLAQPVAASAIAALCGATNNETTTALLERGVLARDPMGYLRIARPALRHALYAKLSKRRRRALHRACHDAVTDPHMRAVHAVGAGDADAAATEGLAAAEQRFTAQRYAEAAELFEDILGILPAHSSAVRTVRLHLGEIARRQGDLDAAQTWLAPLVAAQDSEAMLTMARAADAAARFDRAGELFAALIDREPTSTTAFEAARDLARSHIKRGRNAEAVAVVDAALALEPPTGLADELSAARAFATGVLGDDTAPLTELAELAARARALGEKAVESQAANYEAVLAFRRGDYARAHTRYLAALEAASAVGDVLRIGTLRMNLGSLAFHAGQYARCREHLVTAVALLGAAGADTACTFARRNLGQLLLELGEYEQARAELLTVVDTASALGMESPRAAAHALIGIERARSGDLAAGRDELQRARALFDTLGDQRAVADTLLDMAEVELDAPADERDLAAAARAIDDANTGDDTTRTARALGLRVRLATARRDHDAARDTLAALTGAIEAIGKDGARHVEWTLHLDAETAARFLGDARAAQHHRAAATAIVQDMAAELPPEQRAAFWHDPRRRDLRARPRVIVPSTVNLLDTAPDAGGEVSRTSERLFRLLEIYRRMSSEREVARLLELVMDTAVELSGAERGFLLLAQEPNSDAATLQLAVQRNLPSATAQAIESGELPYSRSIAERVFHTGEPVLSASARQDPRFGSADSVHALSLESVVCIPVHARGRIAGVLYMESRMSTARFSSDDLRLLQAFGDQVAIALENARLLDENARRAAELEAANAKIAALLDERTAELEVTQRDLAQTKRRLHAGTGAFGLVGRSEAMERVFHMIERLAPTNVPVLVLGESGTGKELVARALHEQGPRKSHRIVSINCGALPEELLASELFGHERGAFTGADAARKGLFQTADGGTLFLDEVGDTPERMQATLLRALQEGVIRPVGSTRDIQVDVRIVAATNRPLDAWVQQGRFRQDLYYRLNVVAIEVPALRDRAGDIPLLCDHFLGLLAERTGAPRKDLSRGALRALSEFSWPGNVRQLEHALTTAVVMSEGNVLAREDFAEALTTPARRVQRVTPSARREDERARIVAALDEHGWNRSKAARALGMPRRTFYRRLADYDIQ